jgi:uncharacterized membrane protein YgcG
MKKYILLFVFFFLSLFVTPLKAQDTGSNFEEITQYKSFITINQDATIDVTEEIHYFFSTPRHGIIWEYPIEYNAYGFRRATSFDLEDVYYYPKENQAAKITAYEQSRRSGWIEIKIGEADITITGDYVYVIKYTLQDVGVSYFEDYDEVYFNVIGPGWQVPIVEAEAYITSFMEPTDRICFTGEEGSTESNCKFSDTSEGIILSTSNLGEYEGLTFAFKYPPDSIEDRSNQIWIGLIISNLGILLPIPIGIILFRLLKNKWKNEKITVIPHYEVPDDLDPLMGGYVYKGKHDYKHISATIIWLATRGYLSLEKEGRKTYLIKGDKGISKEISYIEDLYNSLFTKEEKVNIKKMPSSFTTKVQSIFPKITKYASTDVNLEVSKVTKDIKSDLPSESDKISKLISSIVDLSGYDDDDSSNDFIDKKRVNTKSLLNVFGFITIGFSIFVLFPTLIAFAAVGTAIGIIISAVLLVIVGSKVDIRSKLGNKLYYELEGLKMYINTAEKHRIEFHNDPKKFRGVFEKLLPFAMIFGLEKKWAKEFKDLYQETQPDWYRGDFTSFDAYMISRSISTLNSGVKTATSKAYGSSSGYRSSGWSSGSSGFGGGGSSGGGGGGSGGGSW